MSAGYHLRATTCAADLTPKGFDIQFVRFFRHSPFLQRKKPPDEASCNALSGPFQHRHAECHKFLHLKTPSKSQRHPPLHRRVLAYVLLYYNLLCFSFQQNTKKYFIAFIHIAYWPVVCQSSPFKGEERRTGSGSLVHFYVFFKSFIQIHPRSTKIDTHFSKKHNFAKKSAVSPIFGKTF